MAGCRGGTRHQAGVVTLPSHTAKVAGDKIIKSHGRVVTGDQWH